MSSNTQEEYIAALTDLHSGLERKGPGDPNFSRQILDQLPVFSNKPKIADLGCGSGVATLLLAKYFQSEVLAVDASSLFIEELKTHIQQQGLEHLITAIQGDMANLDWPTSSIDLLWSEGAAYNLGFEQALTIWRPLLATTGVAVISEMSWFQADVPEPALTFWNNAYPNMGTEPQNIDRAQQSGYEVLKTQRLPTQAWWVNYYEPLQQKMQQLAPTSINQTIIQETEEEISLFAKYSDFYGYTFYILTPKS